MDKDTKINDKYPMVSYEVLCMVYTRMACLVKLKDLIKGETFAMALFRESIKFVWCQFDNKYVTLDSLVTLLEGYNVIPSVEMFLDVIMVLSTSIKDTKINVANTVVYAIIYILSHPIWEKSYQAFPYDKQFDTAGNFCQFLLKRALGTCCGGTRGKCMKCIKLDNLFMKDKEYWVSIPNIAADKIKTRITNLRYLLMLRIRQTVCYNELNAATGLGYIYYYSNFNKIWQILNGLYMLFVFEPMSPPAAATSDDSTDTSDTSDGRVGRDGRDGRDGKESKDDGKEFTK